MKAAVPSTSSGVRIFRRWATTKRQYIPLRKIKIYLDREKMLDLPNIHFCMISHEKRSIRLFQGHEETIKLLSFADDTSIIQSWARHITLTGQSDPTLLPVLA